MERPMEWTRREVLRGSIAIAIALMLGIVVAWWDYLIRLEQGTRVAADPPPAISAPRQAGETVCLTDAAGKTTCYRLSTLPSGLTHVEPYDPCTPWLQETRTP